MLKSASHLQHISAPHRLCPHEQTFLRGHEYTPYMTALTTISTRVSPSSVTARHARIGGLLRSAHSSQARFISGFRFMSAMYTMAVRMRLLSVPASRNVASM